MHFNHCNNSAMHSWVAVAGGTEAKKCDVEAGLVSVTQLSRPITHAACLLTRCFDRINVTLTAMLIHRLVIVLFQ